MSPSAVVPFTIDTEPPVVEVVGPPDDVEIRSDIPFTAIFSATDDDGASGDVVREKAYLTSDGVECEVYDGLGYGTTPEDGLLSNEVMHLDRAELCRIALHCAFPVFAEPDILIRAWDCAGNEGSDSRSFPGDLVLTPTLCEEKGGMPAKRR